MTLSLSDAIKDDRLGDFIADEEARGVRPIAREDFNAGAAKLIKATRLEGRISRSSFDDGSTGKKTRRDTAPRTSR